VGVKRQESQTGQSPSSSAEVKIAGAMPCLPLTLSWCSAGEIEHKDNFCILMDKGVNEVKV
jgi:hypothetical protein